jgi:spoIIIJ-associated protein
MEPLDTAQEILDSMLGYLGFAATVSSDRASHSLQVATSDGKILIGRHGERLEEITHLLNRLLLDRLPEAPRVSVDIDGYLASRDFRMLEEAETVAARVVATGKTMKLEPMNSYQRRLVHKHFQDHPQIRSWSPEDSARLKRISLSPRREA